MIHNPDFSLLHRSTVGFDQLLTMLNSLGKTESIQTYPPYDIEKINENLYFISIAVAGFSDEEISIELHRNTLTITGERKRELENTGIEVLYRGIAARNFQRSFQLAEDVEVKEASLENGLLRIHLQRNLPEEMKPRKIKIEPSSVVQKVKTINSSFA